MRGTLFPFLLPVRYSANQRHRNDIYGNLGVAENLPQALFVWT